MNAAPPAIERPRTTSWLSASIKWIMLVSGVLTCTMFYATIAPHAAMRSTFGDTLDGPVAEIIVRSWAALVGLVGAMLIYGAYHPEPRPLILTVASLGKVLWITLVLIFGRHYLAYQAGLTVVADSVMVMVFAGYLLRERING